MHRLFELKRLRVLQSFSYYIYVRQLGYINTLGPCCRVSRAKREHLLELRALLIRRSLCIVLLIYLHAVVVAARVNLIVHFLSVWVVTGLHRSTFLLMVN